MRKPHLAASIALALVVGPAFAEDGPAKDAPRPEMVQGRLRPGQPPAQQPPQAPRADPTQQALVQMVSEAQQREAGALVQAYTLRAQMVDLERRLDEATKRAEAAEEQVKLLRARLGDDKPAK